MLLPFIAAFGIMIASLVGVVFVAGRPQESITKHLPYFISFSAGVFLFTAGFMTIESYHIFENIWYTLGGVVGGYLLATLATRLLPKLHHHHDECCDGHEADGKNVLVGDALHNIADGLILVPAFMVSPLLGFGTAFSLFFHEALQEISEFLVLKKAGYSTKKALLYNFGVSATILIGVVIGFIIADTVFLQGILLSLSAGFFLYIISHDLIPHQHLSSHGLSGILKHIGLIVIGVLLVAGVNTLVGAEHTHDHEHDDTHEEEHILHENEHDHTKESHTDTEQHEEEHHSSEEHVEHVDIHTDDHSDEEHDEHTDH